MKKVYKITKTVLTDGEDYAGKKIYVDGMTIPDALPVYLEHDLTRSVGVADIVRSEGAVVANMILDNHKLNPEDAEQLEGSVGGKIYERDGDVVKKFTVNYISLGPKETT